MPGVVLMAAGNASRFGQNKLLLPFAGRPAIEHTMRVLADAGLSTVAVVTQYPQITALARAYGFLAVENPDPGAGVSLTIRLGLAALLAHDPALCGCLFAVGDQPRLCAKSVAGLYRAWQASPSHILAMAHAGRRGNPVLFPKECFASLMQLTGDTGGGAVIRANPELLRLYEIADARELIDADTPQEWKELDI